MHMELIEETTRMLSGNLHQEPLPHHDTLTNGHSQTIPYHRAKVADMFKAKVTDMFSVATTSRSHLLPQSSTSLKHLLPLIYFRYNSQFFFELMFSQPHFVGKQVSTIFAF